MQSYLIIGGTGEERLKKAQQMMTRLPDLSADRQDSGWQIDKTDIIVLEAKNSLGIATVRQLQHQLALKPYSSKLKLALIPQADKLTSPAQNAMLKLLEEPPQDTIIILTSPTSGALLPTIVSRCQLIPLTAKTQIEISQEIINEQITIIKRILKSGVGERIKMAGEIAKTRDDVITFCQRQLFIWREKMVKEKDEKQQAMANQVIREIQKTLRFLEANVNLRLALENLILRMPRQ